MNRIILIICMILCATTLFAQWEWQNPCPQGNDLSDIFISSDGFYWCVGDYGTILRSDDGGETFDVIYTQTDASLNAIRFFNTQTGFVAGDQGTLLKSTDGGNTWTPIPNDTSVDFRAISLQQPEKIWVTGSQGIILHSSDGGETWIGQYNDPGISLDAVFFTDPMTGWVAGSDSGGGILLHTDNGGNTWNLQYVNDTCFFEEICFTGPMKGWAVGNGMILHTEDGGTDWQVQYSTGIPGAGVPPCGLLDVCFTDDNNGWVVGNNNNVPWQGSVILHTDDGGVSWEGQTGYWIRLNSVCFRNPSAGCAVGESGKIITTADGGATWEWASNYTPNHLAKVFFTDNQNGWAVGGNYVPYGNIILHTSDGGGTWSEQDLPVAPEPMVLESVFFTSPENGWAAGFPEAIIHTSDGGTTWELQRLSTSGTVMKDLWFTDSLTGWAVGGVGWQDPVILATSDGGNTWVKKTGITSKQLTTVLFVSSDEGWMAGNGTILHTSDGGLTWEEQWNGSAMITDLSFYGSVRGWALAGDTLLMTSDGGVTWTGIPVSYPLGPDDMLNAIRFTDEVHGYLMGMNGLILFTDDGGQTWIRQAGHNGKMLADVFFTCQNEGWIVGSEGTILHTSNGGVSGFHDPPAESVHPEIRCFPNPYAFSVTLQFKMTAPELVDITFVDHLGRVVGRISLNGNAGMNQVTWDAVSLPGGIYFVRLQAGNLVEIKKIIKL